MPSFNQHLRNVGHETQTRAIWAGEQLVTSGFKLVSGVTVQKLARAALEGTANWHTYALSYTGLGLGLAVRSYILYRDHGNEEENILDFYRREVAASRKMVPEAVTVDDLHAVAEQVPALQDALDRNDRERNLKIAAWITAGVIAGTAMMTVFIGGMALLPLMLGGGSAVAGLASPWLIPAAITTSTAIFHVAKEVVETGLEFLFKTREATAHDKVEMLAGHNSLRPDQVLDIFITANPNLRARIEDQNDGTPYEKLSPEAREAMVREYDPHLGLRRLANDINHHQVRVQELIFAASGKSSGIPRLENPPPELPQRLMGEIKLGSQRVQKQWQAGREQLGEVRDRVQQTTLRMGEAYREGGVKRAFTEMVGKNGGKPQGMSWEQYGEARAAAQGPREL